MKRILSYLCAVVLIFSSFVLGFGFSAQKNSSVSFAADLPEEQLMEGIVLTQDGHTITSADFEKVEGSMPYLYTNATITINKITSSASNELSVSYDSAPLAPKIEGKQWVLKYDEEHVSDTPNLVEMTLSNAPSSGEQHFLFYLVQTPHHFKVNPTFYFENDYGQTITAPTQTQTFEHYLTLKGIVGTEYCPVYVDLYYNGEFFSIYSKDIGGGVIKYFSNITGNEVDINAVDGIKFNAAGQYEIYIYDKTAYSMMKQVKLAKDEFPTSLKPDSDLAFECLDLNKITSATFANIQSYAFTVSETAHNMYITAKDAEGNDVLNSQTVNSSVVLSFHNLSYTEVEYIKVLTKYGSNPETEDIIKNEDLDDLVAEGLYFFADATYRIRFYDDNDNVILPPYDTNGDDYEEGHVYSNANMFAFSIVKDIHTTYRDIRASQINVIESKDQKDIIVRFYTGIKESVPVKVNNVITSYTQKYLEGVNPYNFTVMLANPDTRISGVANGGSTDGTQDIIVNGVGKIEVIVSVDSTTNTYILENGAKIPNTSAIGKYTIKITDQMGNKAQISFTVKQPLNVATIALIVTGAVLLAVVILLIVKTRTKINVR